MTYDQVCERLHDFATMVVLISRIDASVEMKYDLISAGCKDVADSIMIGSKADAVRSSLN